MNDSSEEPRSRRPDGNHAPRTGVADRTGRFDGIRRGIPLALVASLVAGLAWWSRPARDSLLVEFDAVALRVEGRTVSPVVANAKDGFPDFPDSAYAPGTLEVVPLRNAILPWSRDRSRPLRLAIPDSFLFATWKPLLVTARDAGFDSALVDGSTAGAVPILLSRGTTRDPSSGAPEVGMAACLIMRADSVVARHTCAWPYGPSDGPGTMDDSALHRILLDNEIRERIAVVPTRHTPRQIAAFVDSLEAFVDDGSWVRLEMLPKVPCGDFVGFHRDFDSVSLSRGRVALERRFDDDILAFRIRNPTRQAQPRRALASPPRKPDYQPLILEMGAE